MASHLCGMTALIVVLGAPTARAQDTTAAATRAPAGAQRTHTVKKGDTLWDLARTYIGDPFQWPEIYRINQDVVEDPHWIYPGEVLRIPGQAELAEVPSETQPETPRVVSRETVFSPVTVGGVGTALIGGDEPRATVKMGEFERAPYVDRRGAPHGSGRILGTTELDPSGQPLVRQQYQLYERVFITAPTGSLTPVGSRFVAVARGPELERMGQVIVPTAILEVVKAPAGTAAAEARVLEIFDAVRPQHRLLAYDSTVALGTARAVAVEGAQRPTKVRWIVDQPELPTLQHYVLLEVGARQGVHMGDEYVLYEPQRSLGDDRPRSQDIEVARVQVVRVTPQASTAMVIGQRRPSIRPGVLARLAARVP